MLRFRWLTVIAAARDRGRVAVARLEARQRVHADRSNEGTLLYMPTTLPGMSVTKAAELVQLQDRIIKSFPEVESVIGKAGAPTRATDPAPL